MGDFAIKRIWQEAGKAVVLRYALQLLIGGLLVWAAGHWAAQYETQQRLAQIQRSLAIHAVALQGTVARFEHLPRMVAQHPALLDALSKPLQTQRIQPVNTYLAEIGQLSGADAIYLMDASGQTIASSNWRTPQSFVGHNYANRPYVIDALSGQNGRFYGVGKTTGTPGLFFSVPVQNGQSVLGVVAVKVDLRQIQDTWRTELDPIALADDKGIFFLSSEPSWLYRAPRALSAKNLEWLHRHDVYGQPYAFKQLPWVSRTIDAAADAQLVQTQVAGRSKWLMVLSQPLPQLGWTLTVTANPIGVTMARERAWLVAGLVWLCAVLGLSYLALRKRKMKGLENLVAERTRALADAHAFRKSMEDSLLVGMRARDLEGRIVYVNPAFCSMTGYTPDELIGKLPPYPYWHPDDMDKHWRDNQASMTGQAALTGFESRIRHQHGHDVHTMVYTAPLINADGVQSGWMSSVVDLTEQKQAQMAQQLQDEQLQLVQRRTIMNEMASTLAHEINQPLMAIGASIGAAKLFAQQGNMPMLMERLTVVSNEKKRAATLVQKIKDHVRHQTRGAETCDMNDLIKGVLALLGAELKSNRIQVSTQLFATLPNVVGDRVLLEQVLVNLILNSVQAMTQADQADQASSKPKQLSIRTEWSQDLVLVRVADNGPGVAAEVADQIFKNFVTTKKQGLGIGLSICRSIVESHRGRLQFENQVPSGVVFSMYLPF